MKWHKNTDEDFIEAAKHSTSIAGMCRYLDRSPYGAGYYMMHKKIKELGIDTSHFTGCGWNTEGKHLIKREKTPDEIVFCEKSQFATSKLKNRLIRGGYKEERCEKCGRTEWEGKKIPLQTHHINGVKDDNRLENLMLLCPNCHAQTDNYCSKNRKKERTISSENEDKKKIKKLCPICGKIFFCEKDTQKYCSQDCAHKSVSKRPEKEILEKLIKEYSNCAIAKMYGVSDRMVGKWRQKYGI